MEEDEDEEVAEEDEEEAVKIEFCLKNDGM